MSLAMVMMLHPQLFAVPVLPLKATSASVARLYSLVLPLGGATAESLVDAAGAGTAATEAKAAERSLTRERPEYWLRAAAAPRKTSGWAQA